MSDEKKLTRYSKFISLVLRHDPNRIGITLDEAGWTDVSTLLMKAQSHTRGKHLTRDRLEAVVETNNKKRFEFSEDRKKIRARQGHSVPVDLGDEPQIPPDVLFHGTSKKSEAQIRSGGLLKMARHAVHMSSDYNTAVDVGSRHGRPLVVEVKARKMHDHGFIFYLTANGVWYTEHIPKDYLVWPGDREYQSCQPDLRG